MIEALYGPQPQDTSKPESEKSGSGFTASDLKAVHELADKMKRARRKRNKYCLPR